MDEGLAQPLSWPVAVEASSQKLGGRIGENSYFAGPSPGAEAQAGDLTEGPPFKSNR